MKTVLGVDNVDARQWALENLHEPIALPDLAGHSLMSLRTFARRFTEEVSMSPGRWLIQQRIDRARHFLESTDLRVDEITGQVGFAGGTSIREHPHRQWRLPARLPAHFPWRPVPGIEEPRTYRHVNAAERWR